MNIANHLSVLRILLVPVFISSLLYYSPDRAYFHQVSIFIFILACMTDGVDGYLARKLDLKTALGSYLDPIADKLLLLSGFLSLSFMSHLPAAMRIPAWVTIPVITRDAVILIGSFIIFLTTGNLKAEPLFIGKLTTVFQMICLFLALWPAPALLQLIFFIGVVMLTLISGIQYIKIGGRLTQ